MEAICKGSVPAFVCIILDTLSPTGFKPLLKVPADAYRRGYKMRGCSVALARGVLLQCLLLLSLEISSPLQKMGQMVLLGALMGPSRYFLGCWRQLTRVCSLEFRV